MDSGSAKAGRTWPLVLSTICTISWGMIGCGVDTGFPETGGIAAVDCADLTGRFRAIDASLIDADGAVTSIAAGGLTGDLIFDFDADTFTSTLAAPGSTAINAAGTFTFDDETLFFDDETIFPRQFVQDLRFNCATFGDRVLLTTNDTRFDLDADGVFEPAEARIELGRF